MYRKCTTEISVQHQKQVEDALLQLLQKMPFEEISVTELCRLSGVSRRVFYHLFSSKLGALHGLIDHRILGMGSYRPEEDDQTLRFFSYWKDQKELLDGLWRSNLTGLLIERLIVTVLNEDYDIQYWLRANGWRQEKDILIYHITGIMGLILSWYYGGYQKSPQQMAMLMNELLFRPMVNPGI